MKTTLLLEGLSEVAARTAGVECRLFTNKSPGNWGGLQKEVSCKASIAVSSFEKFVIYNYLYLLECVTPNLLGEMR